MSDTTGARTLQIKLHLIALGFVGSALASIPLTVIGKLIAGAPPADLRNYIWNMSVFGIIGSIASPLLTWTRMRRVPLWRTIVEPGVGGLLGASAGMLFGFGVGVVLGGVFGTSLAAARLAHVYRERDVPWLLPDGPLPTAMSRNDDHHQSIDVMTH